MAMTAVIDLYLSYAYLYIIVLIMKTTGISNYYYCVIYQNHTNKTLLVVIFRRLLAGRLIVYKQTVKLSTSSLPTYDS
jgi:hypothetical protein